MLECCLPFTSGTITGFMIPQMFETNYYDLRIVICGPTAVHFDGDWLIESVVFLQRPFD